jgi:glycosyltransferase involved in cell wall biosynthesis
MEADVPEDRIEVVYDGVSLPAETASGDRIIAPATDDPMKGSDLIREAAELAGFRVHFSADLAADLRTASLLVYITRSEGLGSAALLAMAFGVPVVASRTGGLVEIVEDSVNGILTDNEPGAIADAMIRALASRDMMGRNARRCIEQKFSVDHMIARTQRVYHELLGAHA